MDKLKNCLLVALGFTVLMLTLNLTNTGPAVAEKAAGSSLVQVTNTPAQSVPTIDESARRAFQRTLNLSVPQRGDNALYPQMTASFQVPTGKRLVVEYVSGYSQGNPNSSPHLITTVDRAVCEHRLTVLQGWGTGAFAQPVRIYADPGTTVQYTTVMDDYYGSSMSLTVSGYLVDMP